MLARSYGIAGDFKRIYFYHIRKAAGTSVNHVFLSPGAQQIGTTYNCLSDKSNHRLISNGRCFVGWNKNLIEGGVYFYAFSHIPQHALKLPSETFTVTCLRDPARRMLSHYKMLLTYAQRNSFRSDYERELRWMGNSFGDFLDDIPDEHLFRQLYMFSKSLSVDEAFHNICGLSHFFFAEEFDRGIKDLSTKLGIPLTPTHLRKSRTEFEPSETESSRLRSVLEPEFALYERLRQAYKAS